MGYRPTYICKTCGYKVITSGGRDAGFRALTDTYLCPNCMEIVDVLVGYMGHSDDLEERKKSFKKCPLCKGEVTTKWDINTKPCPKCQSTLEIDPKGSYMRWD